MVPAAALMAMDYASTAARPVMVKWVVVKHGKTITGRYGLDYKECQMRIELDGVTEYCEGLPVELVTRENGALVLRARNEGGYNSTEVDLMQLLAWLRTNRPDIAVKEALPYTVYNPMNVQGE